MWDKRSSGEGGNAEVAIGDDHGERDAERLGAAGLR
jgi:hypothetical protein